MKNKNLLLIGGGLLALYFIFKKKTTTTTTNTVQPLPQNLATTGRPLAPKEIMSTTIENAPLLPVYNDDTLDTIDFVEGIV